MALDEEPKHHHRHRRHRSTSSRTRSIHTTSRTSRNVKAPLGILESSRPESVDALRAARLKYLTTPPEERRKKMKYVGESVTKTKVIRPDEPKTESSRNRESRQSRTTPKPQRRTSRVTSRKADEDNEADYVYGRPAQEQATSRYEASDKLLKTAKPQSTPTKRKSESSSMHRVPPPRRYTEPVRRRESAISEKREPRSDPISEPQTPATHSRRPSSRPSLRRSATQQKASSPTRASSIISTTHSKKQPSLISNIFRPNIPPTPEKKVSCLTCGSDVRISNTAKLACTHRM